MYKLLSSHSKINHPPLEQLVLLVVDVLIFIVTKIMRLNLATTNFVTWDLSLFSKNVQLINFQRKRK